ncbi:MAG: ATP-binding protein [Actinomycetota bacterium]
MNSLPTGIVTFAFTDIEGSTRLLQSTGGHYRQILEEHAEIIRGAVAGSGGVVVGTEGDSIFAVFASPKGALAAASRFQRELFTHPFPAEARVRVRVGIHSGEGVLGGDNYVGLDVHKAARIAAAGHGGQVLVSKATAGLVDGQLPDGTSLRPLGGHLLKDLEHREELFQLVIEGLPTDFPRLRTVGTALNNLPIELTGFVSRPELGAIVDLLSSARLVTLTGSGGTGKTRLSLHVAADLADKFPDGVWFVPLAAISQPELVTTAVTSTLGLAASAEDPDRRLAEYLQTKQLLLVLDNFEQVLTAAPQVAGWLRGADELKVLVTSRSPLHIYGEQEFSVPPLAVPPEDEIATADTLLDYPSVRLFVERAKAARPDFALEAHNAGVVVDIVAGLDGLPLAIELAAARVRHLPLEAIRRRLSTRLDFLTGGPQDLAPRQRTLRAAVMWSYELLDPQHRRLFSRLGVFRNGFELEQAEEVCGPGLEVDVLDGLIHLGDQSLLRPVETSGEPRFLMLETIREFAIEQLQLSGEEDGIRHRHFVAYLKLAERAAPLYTRSESRRWLDHTERDHENLRAALDRATDQGEAEVAHRLAGSLWRFWQMRGYLREGRQRTAKALALRGGSPRSRIIGEEAAGGLAYWQADMEGADEHYRRALDLAREIGDPTLTAHAQYNRGSSRALHAGVQAALADLDEALELAETIGDQELIGRIHWGKGTVLFLHESAELDDPQAALVEFLMAADALSGTGATFDIGWTERMLAAVLLTLRRVEEAEAHLRKGLSLFVEAGDLSALPLHVRDYVQVLLNRKDYQTALVLAGAAASLQSMTQTNMLDLIANNMRGLDVAIAAVGPERAEKLVAEGESFSIDQILSIVLDHLTISATGALAGQSGGAGEGDSPPGR